MTTPFSPTVSEPELTASEAKRARMEEYLDWLLTPEGERDPSLKTQLAERLGVSLQTLHNYDGDRWLQDEYMRRARGHFKVAKFGRVLDTLYQIATNPSHKASVTAANAILRWVETNIETESTVDLSKYTDEEIMDAAVRLAQQTNG